MVKEVHRSLVLSPALLEKPSHLWCAACSWQVDSLHGGNADPHKGNRGQSLSLADLWYEENITFPVLTGLAAQPSSPVQKKHGLEALDSSPAVGTSSG